MFHSNSENFFEFFLLLYPMVPPFFFGHSVRTIMADGGPKLKNKWCSKKIENVPTCLGNTHVHVHGELHNSRISIFYPRPTLWNTNKMRNKVSKGTNFAKTTKVSKRYGLTEKYCLLLSGWQSKCIHQYIIWKWSLSVIRIYQEKGATFSEIWTVDVTKQG